MKKKILIALAILALVVCVFASCGGGCEHNFEAKADTNTATCTEPGQETYVCSLCGAEEVRDSLAKGHDLDTENAVVVEPTCKTGGYTTVECKNCDYSEKQRETNPDTTNTIYLIQPTFFRGCSGTLYGKKSNTIAVQQAYPHQPLPKTNGPKILATA